MTMAFVVVIDVDDEEKNRADKAHKAPRLGATMLSTDKGMPEWQSS